MSRGGLVWIQATSDEVRGGMSRARGQAAAGVLHTTGVSHWNSGPRRRQPCRFRQRTASWLLHAFCLPSPGPTQLTGSCHWSLERRVSVPEIQEGEAHIPPRARAYPGTKNLCGCQMPWDKACIPSGHT